MDSGPLTLNSSGDIHLEEPEQFPCSSNMSPIKVPSLSRHVSSDDDTLGGNSARVPATPSSGGAASKAAPVYKFVLTGGPCSGESHGFLCSL
jgi:hypothetical protein